MPQKKTPPPLFRDYANIWFEMAGPTTIMGAEAHNAYFDALSRICYPRYQA